MSAKVEYRAAARVILSLLVLVFGISLSGLAFLRLGHGPFPYATGRILKLVLGIVLSLGGWITLETDRWRSVVQFCKTLWHQPQQVASGIRWLVLPPAAKNSHSLLTRLALTAVMFGGLGMMVLSLVRPPAGFELEMRYPSEVLRLGGLALALLSGYLRSGTRAVRRNDDWLRASEMLLLIGLAIAVTAVDIHFSKRIGLLASPPFYDGVQYMLDARGALSQFESWRQHPTHAFNVIMGNGYPAWQALLALNYRLWGVGEWQAYAVRFWPALVILATAFWVVRRRAGPGAGWAAALFTALLPTLSLNLRSAAGGHWPYPSGYLTDLRPDLLFAAFLTLAVVLLVEHARNCDERTATLAGIAMAFAAQTKASATVALFLACGMAGMYMVLSDRGQRWRNLQTILWGVLAFTILLTPWMLTGGITKTIDYVWRGLTVELPLYSNPQATIRSELTYYYPLLIGHMGWQTVALVLASPVLLWVPLRRKGDARPQFRDALVYLLIAGALYGLVSASLSKNYFLGLSSYLVLWIFCWLSISTFIGAWPSWSGRLGKGLLAAAIVTVALAGVLGARGLDSWQGHEFEEGRQDRAVMQQIALDLRELLSNEETFLAMPAYGNPDTLLFYMPYRQGEFPRVDAINAIARPPVEDLLRQEVDPIKAVLIYANGNKQSSYKEWISDVNLPYYLALPGWLQRAGSAHRLRKTYQFYRAPGSDQAEIELYVRDDPR